MSERLVSPMVNEDRSVTFQLKSEYAEHVEIDGDLRLGRARVGPHTPVPSVPMTKTRSHVWTYRTEPVHPGIYRYCYIVDGLRTLDPLNPWKSYVERGDAYSLVQVRGDTMMPWEMVPEIPHGTIVLEKVYSTTLQQLKPCAIYLPAGYSTTGKRYPVLYLLHGGGGNYLAWLFNGYVDNILDAYFTRPNVNKYVVVMPEGHVSTPEDHYQALATRGHATGGAPSLFHANFSAQHVHYVVHDLLPYIEERYHIAADKRALAGLSMGGGQSLNVAMHHPELFHALGIFSSGSAERLLDQLPHVKEQITKIETIYVSGGVYDTALDIFRATHQAMEGLAIPHTYVETDDGGHIWQVWRNALLAFLSLIDASR